MPCFSFASYLLPVVGEKKSVGSYIFIMLSFCLWSLLYSKKGGPRGSPFCVLCSIYVSQAKCLTPFSTGEFAKVVFYFRRICSIITSMP